MKYLDLRNTIKQNIFTVLEVKQYFTNEVSEKVIIQLSRFSRKGLITPIKRGLYCFDQSQIDEFELASKLYKPSYVSCETALNYYGIIPDVPSELVSVTLVTTKYFSNDWGKFRYLKIKKGLFWGFTQVKLAANDGYFLIAEKEKALLDFFYFRKIKRVDDLRLNLREVDNDLYLKYASFYPKWVGRIKIRF